MKILLLEDDLILNEIIEEFLQDLGYDVTCVYDGMKASEIMYDEQFDLLILDVNVPSITGFDFLKSLRDESITTPAIFITSLNSIEDIEEGFNVGADDYLKKPFELKELELRINNIKRLLHLDSDELVIGEGINFNTKLNYIDYDGIKTKLPLKEAQVLKYLLKNTNRCVSQDELSSNIWSYESAPTSSTIRTYIKNIRKIVGEEYIETIKGVGYRFNKK
ncbi:DNA-binding response regulator [Arcobacter sp. F155]|uniref:response regulator transcription factor n=1 Tax=Arcobacteraceae TaxID=2808963 RepID=UPI00100B022C|nr:MULTISPECIES: response regulator transcription factor [unclassified Arcobacter]RXJ77723.1 DNA-binding response regulator [Arcobacter sp. F155]RXJ98294.1 DNA-binding response regulator [Arcobacter sp. CECT 8989]